MQYPMTLASRLLTVRRWAQAIRWLALVLSMGTLAARAASTNALPLEWDALQKESWPKEGDPTAEFSFSVTNVSDVTATVASVRHW